MKSCRGTGVSGPGYMQTDQPQEWEFGAESESKKGAVHCDVVTASFQMLHN